MIAGSPAAILARQQKLVGTARRQLHMSRFTSPVPAQLDACKLRPRSGVQVLSTADHQQSKPQQHIVQKRTEPAMFEEDSGHANQSDSGEIFPTAAPEGAQEAAAGGKLTDGDSDTGVASAAVTDNVQQPAAADDPAILSPFAQGPTPGADAAVFQDPHADCAVISRSDDQSVSAIIQYAAASVADASDANIPTALLLYGEGGTHPDARAEVSAQQGAWHGLPGGSDTDAQYGKEYPWMEVAEQAAVRVANSGQLAKAGTEGSSQQAHVTFASGGMTSAEGNKVPMRYLAAAAADRRLAAEEAAAAAAAASAAADRRSIAKTAAAAEAAAVGTAMQVVMVTQAGNADIGDQIRQAAEQDWSQSTAPSEHVEAPAMLALPRPSQPPDCKLHEPEDTDHSLDTPELDHAQGGVGVITRESEGNEQSDAASVASFANSAASGLGHLLRAQQPWSESSSSPDRSSTTGSAGMRDISQLEAEVMSQPDAGYQLPQQLPPPDQEAVAVGGQLPMQLPLAQEQPQHAQHGLMQHQEAKLVIEDAEDQQQRMWHSAGQGDSQHDGSLNLPVAAGYTDASTSLVDHASGKQATKSLRLPSIGDRIYMSLFM